MLVNTIAPLRGLKNDGAREERWEEERARQFVASRVGRRVRPPAGKGGGGRD